MTQLTEHFHLSEFTRSQTAVRRNIRNAPGPNQIAALKLLCEKVLEPVRGHFGKPVRISSGYRSPILNRAIGGSITSQHCKGQAADFTIPGVPNRDVLDWMHKNLNYDQLIDEYNPNGWIHVSYREPYRNMELSARRGRGFLPGLHR